MVVLLALDGAERKPDVTMQAVLVMLMRQHAVTVSDRVVHRSMMPSAPTGCPFGSGDLDWPDLAAPRPDRRLGLHSTRAPVSQL
jgi:hypothetical protein